MDMTEAKQIVVAEVRLNAYTDDLTDDQAVAHAINTVGLADLDLDLPEGDELRNHPSLEAWVMVLTNHLVIDIAADCVDRMETRLEANGLGDLLMVLPAPKAPADSLVGQIHKTIGEMLNLG